MILLKDFTLLTSGGAWPRVQVLSKFYCFQLFIGCKMVIFAFNQPAK